jgi:hypothetical protein
VPLPAGTLLGSSGAAPHWSVKLLLAQGAARALQSTTAFYVAHGFTFDRAGSAGLARYRITFVAQNRDHRATATNLTIALVRY